MTFDEWWADQIVPESQGDEDMYETAEEAWGASRRQALAERLPCGHPVGCYRDGPDLNAPVQDVPFGGGCAWCADLQRVARAAREMQEALIWCSGSMDFGPGGIAYQGWLKVRHLLDCDLDALVKGKEVMK